MGNYDTNNFETAERQSVSNRPDTSDYVPGRTDRDMSDVIHYLGELFSKLSSDAGNLINLQIELLKAELRESTTVLARNSVLIVAGAMVGAIAFAVITLAIIGFVAAVLPITEDIMAWAVAALIVGLVYSLIAGGLVLAGIKSLKSRNMKPERSIEEIKRDKEWVKEIKS